MNVYVKKLFQDYLEDTPLAGSNANYLESLYESWITEESSVAPQWQEFFSQFASKDQRQNEFPLSKVREQFVGMTSNRSRINSSSDFVSPEQGGALAGIEQSARQVKVLQLINAYRFMGHLAAKTNPLGYRPTEDLDRLQLSSHDLSIDDLDTVYDTGSLVMDDRARLSDIIKMLEASYCGSLGAEYMHITDNVEKRWLQKYVEGHQGVPPVTSKQKLRLLKQLTAAEGLERYLHTRYLGQKRFSLEGGESLIPMVNEIVQRSGEHSVAEVVIGMAHRGRLNVLVNSMGKTPSGLFQEFEGGTSEEENGTGDVKYHKGFSSDFKTQGDNVHVVLAFNPSHLEIVNPVVEGSVRARQERRGDHKGDEVLPVLIHGDAAFAGQGVVMETFNMSQSRGFSTKGTIHLVINNQIGFTTSNQRDARSTLYCTDVAKMVNAPIFHVNGDDPEAVMFVSQMAFDYRMKFHKDVVIDLVCYRRHGHSEADEPMATQPEMYTRIRDKVTTREIYATKLIENGDIDQQIPKQMMDRYRKHLDHGDSVCDSLIPPSEIEYQYIEDWKPYGGLVCNSDIETGVSAKRLHELYNKVYELPKDFNLHPGVQKIVDSRALMVRGEMPLDWGCAEILAYATLLTEGYSVRLTGQDCGRGTFFHRHVVLRDQRTSKAHVPLRHLDKDQKNFLVVNSLLSEEAVLAFEYGYATTTPETLTIWEAQFGDFANGAQVVIDQFISAGEQKWSRMCGLVMLLPHGYEGQGPEHSSARLERYLQLCAQENIQVCMPSSASQIFHLLRRQMLMSCRRPLIVMTPKSLLRNKLASSPVEKLTTGGFKKLIPSTVHKDNAAVTRVVLCSGKVYYDLASKVEQESIMHVAIIRVEQLYPFPQEELIQELQRYAGIVDYVWCQEEPKNQGAWYQTQHHIIDAVGRGHELQYAGRPLMAAPAVGLMSLHKQQLEKLVADALALPGASSVE